MSSSPIPTWMLAQSKVSVSLNGVYVPLKNAPDLFQRYVRPAVFSTDDDVWELQYHGSATMVRYQHKHLALTTAHQTGDGKDAPRPERFVVIIDAESRKLSIPPSSVRRVHANGSEHEVAEDILIYEYEDKPEVKSTEFIDLSDVLWSDVDGVEVIYSFLIGFPSESVRIELDPEDEMTIREYKMRWIRQDLEPDECRPLDPEQRAIFKKHKESTRRSVEPDGLSGCPVFSVVLDKARDCQLRFDGIVTHAKGDRFAVYPSSNIRVIIEEIDGSAAGSKKDR